MWWASQDNLTHHSPLCPIKLTTRNFCPRPTSPHPPPPLLSFCWGNTREWNGERNPTPCYWKCILGASSMGTTWEVARNADTQAPPNWKTPLLHLVWYLLCIADTWGSLAIVNTWYSPTHFLDPDLIGWSHHHPHTPQHGLGVRIFLNSSVVLMCSNAAKFESHYFTSLAVPPSQSAFWHLCCHFQAAGGGQRRKDHFFCLWLRIIGRLAILDDFPSKDLCPKLVHRPAHHLSGKYISSRFCVVSSAGFPEHVSMQESVLIS